MIGHAFVAVVHLITQLTQSQAQVDVLTIVQKVGIKAARFEEGGAPEEDAGRGDDPVAARLIDRRVVGREAGINVARVVVLANGHPGVLDGIVEIQQLAAHDRGRRVVFGVLHQRVEPARLRQRVVVEKDEVVTRSRRRTRVAGRGKPVVFRQAYRRDSALVFGQELWSDIGGGVVHYDDLGPAETARAI